MIIQIRVVIDVPIEDQNKYPTAIDNIVKAITAEFPGLKVARPHSPVVVTIKGIENKLTESLKET